jgi:photosystem II stability/assembly factor-like uncharacterized protein
VKQARSLLVAQGGRELHRRQLRSVQDLVGVGVSDAAEDVRIGERALQRVVVGGQTGAECVEIRAQHFEPAAIVLGERGCAAHDVNRGLPLRSGLRQQERSPCEVERREPDFARDRGPTLPPPESSGDHQMDDHEQLVVERDDDAFPEPGHAANRDAFDGRDWRIVRTDDERIADPDALDPLPEDTRPERVEIALDVGEFGHPGSLSFRSPRSAIRGLSTANCGPRTSVRGCGKTWQFMGLPAAGQIGSVVIHPSNPDIAWLAALGSPFGPNDERGVFKTTDGGKTWKKILFVNRETGARVVAINYSNPNELYAGMYRGFRKGWDIISGGPATEGGIYKSLDGGETWAKLSNGLPGTLIGKIDIGVSRSRPAVVFAMVEAPGAEGGLYKTEDSGKSWKLVNIRNRPFYFHYVDVNPKDENDIWVGAAAQFRSRDGGLTFTTVPTPHADNHGIWFNPDSGSWDVACNGSKGSSAPSSSLVFHT